MPENDKLVDVEPYPYKSDVLPNYKLRIEQHQLKGKRSEESASRKWFHLCNVCIFDVFLFIRREE